MKYDYCGEVNKENLDNLLSEIEERFKGVSGIYVFSIPSKSNLKKLKEEWIGFYESKQKRKVSKEDVEKVLYENDEPYNIQKIFNVEKIPSVNSERFEDNERKEFKEAKKGEIALYAGKHNKCLYKRLKEHLEQASNSTYALRLNQFESLDIYKIRIYIKTQNIEEIIGNEREFHKLYGPLIGRK